MIGSPLDKMPSYVITFALSLGPKALDICLEGWCNWFGPHLTEGQAVFCFLHFSLGAHLIYAQKVGATGLDPQSPLDKTPSRVLFLAPSLGVYLQGYPKPYVHTCIYGKVVQFGVWSKARVNKFSRIITNSKNAVCELLKVRLIICPFSNIWVQIRSPKCREEPQMAIKRFDFCIQINYNMLYVFKTTIFWTSMTTETIRIAHRTAQTVQEFQNFHELCRTLVPKRLN